MINYAQCYQFEVDLELIEYYVICASSTRTIMGLIFPLFLTLFLIILLSGNIENAKILGVFHVHSPSHHTLVSKIVRELAQRGHNITVIAPIPQKDKIDNFKEIITEQTYFRMKKFQGKKS